MANTMRWRYGDTKPVVLPVDSATVIEIGDLVYLDTDDAKPASAAGRCRAPKPANQEAFHDKFAGVAMQASRNGDTQPIRVATTGVFEFDCLSSTFEVGKLDRRRTRTPAARRSRTRSWRRRHGQPRHRPLRQARQPRGDARAGGHRQHDAPRRPARRDVADEASDVRCQVSERI